MSDGSGINDLGSVIDEYIDAAGSFTRFFLYPGAGLFSAALPDSFHDWAAGRKEPAISDLRVMHDHLHRVAQGIVLEATASKDRKPSEESYERFTVAYRDFILNLRHFEKTSLQARAGIDPVTGLRDMIILEEDMLKELEQLSRRGGKQFSMVLVRMDNYTEISSQIPQDQKDRVAREIADVVRECLRAFDDAYRISESEFVMILRQTDRNGAGSAIARLQKLLKEHPPAYSLEGIDVRATVSCCASEPVPGEETQNLLSQMKNDLERVEMASGAAIQHKDQSPLHRYIQEESEKAAG